MPNFLEINGIAAESMRLYVPWGGVWSASLVLPTPDEITGSASVAVGSDTLTGTVRTSGKFGSIGRVMIYGGADGWKNVINGVSYHNDAGVKAVSVIRDAAAAAGETLGDVNPASADLGPDWVRVSSVASITLDVAGGSWWVDYDGVTHVGERSGSTVDASAVQILDYDPERGIVPLGLSALGDVKPGDTLTVDGVNLTVRSLQVTVDSKGLEAIAYVRPEQSDRIADLLLSLADRAVNKRFLGLYEYRVTGMSGDRVNLQSVEGKAPDLSAVSVYTAPGVAAQLTNGGLVAVGFLDGKASKPVVLGCTPPDKDGFEPSRLDLGGKDGVAAATLGGTVSVMFPPVVPFSGTLSGAPIVGTMQLTVAATGVIQGGSSKVFIKQ